MTAAVDVEQKLPQVPRDIQPGTIRHDVLMAARRFKSTWVELGALLIRVRKEALHETWGYKNFEDYCLKELHIRRQTALKLTNSYAFLEKHERDLLNRPPEDRPAPAFEVVEVLAKAEERGQLTEKEYAAIRDDIWKPEQEQTKTPSELAKELSAKFPAPPPPPTPLNIQLRRFANTAKRFSEELRGSKEVPGAVKERAAALAEDLAELVKSRSAEA